MIRIKGTRFDGLEACELTDGEWRMTVVTACGPRIAFLGQKDDDENILYWHKDGVIRNDWHLHGGHRVWLTRPMADESEDTYLPDNQPCQVKMLENGIIATAPVQNGNMLERGMRVECLGNGVFQVTNSIKNAGDLIYSGGVWSPTCINPQGKTLRIPLGVDGASWDIVKVVIPLVFAGNVSSLEDQQVRFEGNDMVVIPMGRAAKRCVSAPKGTIIMRWEEKGITFTKRTSYDPFARYPLDGCNLAVFVGKDNWMAEMESFGPEQPIIPGQTITHTEIWELKS